MIVTLIFFLSFLFCSINNEILLNIYKKQNWRIVDNRDNKNILEAESNINNDKYLRIEQSISSTQKNVLDVVESIPEYNEIISNKNVTTELLRTNKDTLICLQKISNAIPFIRDRQYIFKLYRVNKDRVDWYLLNKKNLILKNYLDDNVHTLTNGAGSWEIKEKNEKKILIYRMYIDDEVNFPLVFIQKIRINQAVNIFNDVINWSEGVE